MICCCIILDSTVFLQPYKHVLWMWVCTCMCVCACGCALTCVCVCGCVLTCVCTVYVGVHLRTCVCTVCVLARVYWPSNRMFVHPWKRKGGRETTWLRQAHSTSFPGVNKARCVYIHEPCLMNIPQLPQQHLYLSWGGSGNLASQPVSRQARLSGRIATALSSMLILSSGI